MAVARAQSALDGFDPNANGVVRVVVLQGDGKILLGGDFTALSPNGGAAVPRNHIARLNFDGTLDSTFNPDANDTVRAIAVQADGKILVAGDFHGASSIGGQSRNYIARLDATTGLADPFDPNANSFIDAMALQPDGKIVVGGGFQSIGGQPRNYIARLDPTTGLADAFDPHANNLVLCMVVQPNGKILVGGAFSGANSIGGAMRNHIARLDPVTGAADSFDPNANGLVLALALQADGKVIAGGEFIGADSIGGQTRNRVARLDGATGLADSFNPNANNSVYAIAVQPDGKIIVGGTFSGAVSIGGQGRNHIARFDPTSELLDSFDPSANNSVYAIAVQSDGKILVGGLFNGANSIRFKTRNYIARLETDGGLDQTFDHLLPGGRYQEVLTVAVRPNGKFLIGGVFYDTHYGFTNIMGFYPDGRESFYPDQIPNDYVGFITPTVDGFTLVSGAFTTVSYSGGGPPFMRNHIAGLSADSGGISSFNPNANNSVYAIAVQADGKILVAGSFTSIGGQMRNRIARLNPLTGLADSFDPNADAYASSIGVQADGKILVAGAFTSIGGQQRNRVARLDPLTGLADSFDPNANAPISLIRVQADGKILVAGSFTSIGGQMRNRIARLDPATGLADPFNPNPNDTIRGIEVQADGRIFVGGSFTNIGGQTRNRIARLDATTGLADSFNPSADFPVETMALQTDGKLLVGGLFYTIGGQGRNYFARLANDTPAMQDLAVAQTSITWRLGGASPQFSRVTFEWLVGNIYKHLGNGTFTGNSWTLTGLNLPTGQSLQIRARGYHSGGDSESIMESVRNDFVGVPLLNVVSRKVHGATPFDINLLVPGGGGIECRTGGAAGDYQLIFSFLNPLASVGSVNVTDGQASIISHMIDSDAHNYIVNLSGVSNAQVLSISLTNVTDAAGNNISSAPIAMKVLVGDTNGNGAVSAVDVVQTKVNAGQAVDASNFRMDVNADGSIGATDVSLVKASAGTALP